MFTNFGDHPWRLIFPALALVALAAQFILQGMERWGRAFFASSLFTTMAAGLYPNVLPAHDNRPFGMTIHNAASSEHALTVGLRWWSLGIALAVGYFIVAYRFLFRRATRTP